MLAAIEHEPFNMKMISTILLLLNINSYAQSQDKITLKGWLIYQQDYLLAFFPIKDQTMTPTYENFLKEDKREGERMNGNNSASIPLLIAKKLKLPIYDYNVEPGKEMKQVRREFYVQPVKYVYSISDITADTTTHDYMTGGWLFSINEKPVGHWVYHFPNRSGEIMFLNHKDSVFAQGKGRRNSISIYPPH